jgi:hypothetical protein
MRHVRLATALLAAGWIAAIDMTPLMAQTVTSTDAQVTGSRPNADDDRPEHRRDPRDRDRRDHRDRPQRPERPHRPERPDRPDRPERPERPERPDRPQPPARG